MIGQSDDSHGARVAITPRKTRPSNFTPSKYSPRCPVGFRVAENRSDWPGRSSVTIVSSGCNFRCPYCCEPELCTARDNEHSIAHVLSTIESRAYRLGGVVLSGGEPTLNLDLMSLLEELRRLKVPVKLDTNGSEPDMLTSMIYSGLVACVALDIKTVPERYSAVAGMSGAWERVRRSIDIILQSGVAHEFRTTCYPFSVRTEDLPAIAAQLVGGERYVLQQFRPRRTLDPAAATVTPVHADALRYAAMRCTVSLPTVVRGA